MVIPDIEDEYVLLNISCDILEKRNFTTILTTSKDSLKITRNHPEQIVKPHCKLSVSAESITAIPDFTISKKNIAMFGEIQIAVEILTCACENMCSVKSSKFLDEIFAIRFISTYVAFYKVVIPAEYLKELGRCLPKTHLVEILRWPGENGLKSGWDLAEQESLTKIRQTILQ
ncbi:hypothetical protein Glove_208g124 [Diversispora epigaea]|uniref:Uncharacterized protein n=1 Tax=Diversispora epigaea TaxID=1348612 RepID=A0A397INS1_9GLOM|nr:hypothetical protein Glove_208g124 [Diversispora epigaea]